MLCGNRNFEGRINSEVRANYLMSPPLVVAFALAGRIDIDLRKDPRQGQDGKPVYLATSGRRARGRRDHAQSITSEMFSQELRATLSRATSAGADCTVPKGETYTWERLHLHSPARPTSTT